MSHVPESKGEIRVVAYCSDDLRDWGDEAIFSGDNFRAVMKWADKRVSWAFKFRAVADDWNFFEEGVIVTGKIRWNRIPMKSVESV